MIDQLYEDLVTKYSHNFVPVVIPRDTLKKIEWLAVYVMSNKLDESQHIVDSNQEYKRFYTGFMGEAAVELLLGINIIEWSVGSSADYNHPDIAGLDIGIKTVERNKFPIIFKKNDYAQIICIKSDKRDDVVFVCGLATPAVLNRFQSDTLIIDKKLRERGTKTGFYGFSALQKFETVEDLKKLLDK